MKAIIIAIFFTFSITAYASEWLVLNYSGSGSNSTNGFSGIINVDKNDHIVISKGRNSILVRDSMNWIEYDNYFECIDDEFITPNNSSAYGQINNIIIDKDSSFWFASTRGIIHYKNHNWEIYNTDNSNIENNDIRSIIIDNKGNKWISYDWGGISELTENGWKLYNDENSPVTSRLRYYNNVLSVDRQNRILVGDNNKLLILEDEKWLSYNIDSIFNSEKTMIKEFAVDQQNNIWMIINDKGIAKFDGNNWTAFNLNSGIDKDFLTSIAVDSNSNIFVGSNLNGIYKFNGNEWQNFNRDNSPLNNSIGRIVVDSKNQKWIDLSSGTVAVYKEGGITFSNKSSITNSNCIEPFVYPNPFDDITNIEITDNHNPITFKIYNLLGQQVDVINDENADKKRYSIEYDGRHLPSGVYLVRALMENYPYDCAIFYLHKR